LWFATAAAGGLLTCMAFAATAAPVAGAGVVEQHLVTSQHVVQADWYWHHRHWHHRRWYHGGWRYW